jgi:putative membrane-bound dehydrogenase-like protein
MISNCRRWSAFAVAFAISFLGVNPSSAQVGFKREQGHMQITVDGNPLAIYVWDDPVTTRPYFKSVHAPGGKVQLTRNHPPKDGDIDDHGTFHPGLWWGFGDVGGNDYWRLKARSVGGEFVNEPIGGQDQGTFAVRNRLLVNGGDKLFCEQICHYTILRRAEGILMVCESTFQRRAGAYWLGDQEEMGLAFRVGSELAVSSGKGGRVLNSADSQDLQQIRTRQSDWCDYSGPIAGKYAGMMLLNDPANFRKPWWHAVANGLLVANPLGESELNRRGKRRRNVRVKAGESFRLRYGVLLHINDRAEEFDPAAAYRAFVELLPKLNEAPREAAALPSVPEGFEVSIFAREPLVYKPTSLCFDARGRLFVGQGPQYPKNEEGSASDSVCLLIDGDGDGVAERRKEFARGFNSIQGLAWKGRDLYVANAPELTVVRDLDGDDEADEYVVIFTDLGNREHALHGLNFGPDGKLYMSKGNSKGHNQPDKYGYVAPRPFRELWDVEHPPGAPDSYPPKTYTKDNYRKTYHHWDDDWGRQGGVLRCDSNGENLEIVSRGMRNPWDIAFDDGFNWLGTDNDQTQGDRVIMPFFGAHFGWGHRYSSHWTGEGHLPTVPISGPLFSGSGAGIVYQAHENFPPEYRNAFFINDWLFGTYVYRPDWKGALRVAGKGSLEPFMRRSEDGMLYRPTDLEFGPNGSIYSLGWGGNYDYQTGNEGSWIFRITHRDAKPRANQPTGSLRKMTVARLVRDLGPDVLPARRVNAQTELLRRGDGVRGELIQALSETGLTTGQQTWAAWTLGRMRNSRSDAAFLKWANLTNRYPLNLRIQAIRILGKRQSTDRGQDLLSAVARQAMIDPDPRVRFEGVQAVHQAKSAAAVDQLLDLLSREKDRLVFYSGWQALRDLAPLKKRENWLTNIDPRIRLAALLGLQQDHAISQREAFDLVERELDSEVRSWALTYAMNATPPKKMPNTKARVVFDQSVPIADLIERAGKAAGQSGLRLLYLKMIGRASVRSGGQQQELLKFYRRLHHDAERVLVLPALASNLAAFPDLWVALGSEPLREVAVGALVNLVRLRTAALRSTEEQIRSAAQNLSSVNTAATDIATRLLGEISKAGPSDDRVGGALRAIEDMPLPANWRIAGSELKGLLDVLEKRPEPDVRRSALRLLGKLEPASVAGNQRVEQIFTSLTRKADARLYRELTATVMHLGLPLQIPAPELATAAGVLANLAEANSKRGREFFFDPVRGAGCAACHRIQGRGNAVAPDLSGVGSRLTSENMIQAILQPSANITEGYAMQHITMKDGTEQTGAVIRESDSSIALLLPTGIQVSIASSDIRRRKKLNQSVMPQGYELFGNEQLADLTAWLLSLRDVMPKKITSAN